MYFDLHSHINRNFIFDYRSSKVKALIFSFRFYITFAFTDRSFEKKVGLQKTETSNALSPPTLSARNVILQTFDCNSLQR